MSPLSGLILTPSQTITTGEYRGGAFLSNGNGVISWQTQGDYSPILIIFYKDVNDPIIETYSYYQLHVSSLDILQQEKNDNVNSVLTIALFVLAFIESVYLVVDHSPKTEQNSGNAHGSGNQNTANNAHKKTANAKR